MPQPDFVPLQMNPLAPRLDLSDPAGARLPNLALPALAGMGVQAGAQALADFGAGISGSPTLGEQNVAARGTAAELAGLGMGVPAPPGSLSAFLGYHGTPHLFEPEPGAPFGAFRNEAIGSGEGAQAYGWGHYVAGNKGVAKDYQQRLSYNDFINKIRDSYDEFDSPDEAIDSLMKNPDLSQPQQTLLRSLKEDDWLGFDYPHQAVRAVVKEPGNYELSPETAAAAKNAFGHLLEVHILPEESDLLDWDKRLGEQDPQMLDKLQASGLLPSYNPMQLTGEGFYRDLSRRYGDKLAANLGGSAARELGPRAASQALDAAGIPGLRYLDAGSRAAGEGTHNYVLFHPRHLRIIGRNGERLEPVEGDPFAGAGGQ